MKRKCDQKMKVRILALYQCCKFDALAQNAEKNLTLVFGKDKMSAGSRHSSYVNYCNMSEKCLHN